MELLRILHDVWWDRWRRRLEACVLSDDVRHAYGSINHDTEYAILAAARVSKPDARTLQRHDRTLEVHRGGAGLTAGPLPPRAWAPAQGQGALCQA